MANIGKIATEVTPELFRVAPAKTLEQFSAVLKKDVKMKNLLN